MKGYKKSWLMVISFYLFCILLVTGCHKSNHTGVINTKITALEFINNNSELITFYISTPLDANIEFKKANHMDNVYLIESEVFEGRIRRLGDDEVFSLDDQMPNPASIESDESVSIPYGNCRLLTLDTDNGTGGSGTSGTHKRYLAYIDGAFSESYMLDFTSYENDDNTKEIFCQMLNSINTKNGNCSTSELESINTISAIQVKWSIDPDDGSFLIFDDHLLIESEQWENQPLEEINPQVVTTSVIDIVTKTYKEPIVLENSGDIYIGWDRNLAKYDETGLLVWKLDLSDDIDNTSLENIFLANEGLYFITNNTRGNHGYDPTYPYLGYISKDGYVKWIQEIQLSQASYYKEGLIIGDNLYLAGTFPLESYDPIIQSDNEDKPFSLLIASYDKDGNELKTKACGSLDDYDYLYNMIGDEENGLIITGKTTSGRGSLSKGEDERDDKGEQVDYILHLDMNLNVKNLCNLDDNYNLSEGALYIDEDTLYIGGTRTGLFEFDSGRSLINKEAFIGRGSLDTMDLSIMSIGYKETFGDVCLAKVSESTQVLTWTGLEGGRCVVLDTGNDWLIKHDFEIDYDVSQIQVYDYDERRFILVGRYAKSTLPQPVYISSVWYDTAGVIGLYNYKGDVKALKMYDNYDGIYGYDWIYGIK